MVNYGNGKIYKIETINGEGDIYIGSTTKQHLCQRMVEHRNNFKQWKTGVKTGTTSYILFDKYGIDACKIILLETVICNSRDELLARESHWIKTLKCVNKIVPLRTKEEKIIHRKEYYQEHREALLVYYKKRDERIKDVINLKKKENRFTCDCGSEIRIADRCKHFKTGKHLAFLEKNKIV